MSVELDADSAVLYHSSDNHRSNAVNFAINHYKFPVTIRTINTILLLENYEPWYVRLNSGGSVPFLHHNDKSISNYIHILHYMFSQTSSSGSAEETEEKSFAVNLLDQLNLEVFLYANSELTTLHHRIETVDDICDFYSKIYQRRSDVYDILCSSKRVEQHKTSVLAALDELDTQLAASDHSFLCGSEISQPDFLSGSILGSLARLDLDLWNENIRPHLSAYFNRLKDLPSFQKTINTTPYTLWENLSSFTSLAWSLIVFPLLRGGVVISSFGLFIYWIWFGELPSAIVSGYNMAVKQIPGTFFSGSED